MRLVCVEVVGFTGAEAVLIVPAGRSDADDRSEGVGDEKLNADCAE